MNKDKSEFEEWFEAVGFLTIFSLVVFCVVSTL